MKKALDPDLGDAVDKTLDTVADNLKKLIVNRSVLSVAKESGVGRGSLQRILGGSQGYAGQTKSHAQLDTLIRLAWHFRIPISSLFVVKDRASVLLSRVPESEDSPSRDLERRRRRPPAHRP
jgi:hypothetical protein